MSLEWFSRLKEYDSLNRARIAELNSIKEQESRMSSLESRKEQNLAQLSNLKSQHVAFNQELLELEGKLKIQTEQRQRWIDQGGDESRQQSMEKEIATLEEKGMELLQSLETNEEERKGIQTFLDGLQKTINEIQKEVETEVKTHKEKIKELEFRQEGILEMLPAEYKDLLQKVLKKNLAHGPFTRIEGGSCLFCRYKISRIDESEIDMQRKLKICPQCGRIFIPYGT